VYGFNNAGVAPDLAAVLPDCIVQGLLSLNAVIASDDGDDDATVAWGHRLDAAVGRLQRD
jgi:hypothetical protein